jgi:hypothetical protein
MAQGRSTSADDRGGGVFTAISASVLVGTEIIGAAIAAGWAVAGLFELGPPFDYVLMGLFGLGALGLLWMFARSALRIEHFGHKA